LARKPKFCRNLKAPQCKIAILEKVAGNSFEMATTLNQVDRKRYQGDFKVN
jgi:hypothetical protein